jgi:hypothetical protein
MAILKSAPRERATPASHGGPPGNERLTAATGAVLFVLLFVEGITILFLHPLFSEHVFVGMLLVPPVVLKLGSTGYRFARYYTGDPAYRRAGPPQPLLRALAPLVVLTTCAVFGTGVALLVLGPRARWLVGLHKASFVAWFVVTAVHVLAYVWRVPRLTAGDWGGAREPLGGSATRRLAVGGSIAAGVALAAVTLPMADPWITAMAHGG